MLTNIFDNLDFNTQCIIFANKNDTVIDLYEKMTASNDNENNPRVWKKEEIVMVHGKMDVEEKDFNMNQFRKKKARILLTTDALARGIDV